MSSLWTFLFESRKTTELIWGKVRMRSKMAHYCHVCGECYNDHDRESLSCLNWIKGGLFLSRNEIKIASLDYECYEDGG